MNSVTAKVNTAKQINADAMFRQYQYRRKGLTGGEVYSRCRSLVSHQSLLCRHRVHLVRGALADRRRGPDGQRSNVSRLGGMQ